MSKLRFIVAIITAASIVYTSPVGVDKPQTTEVKAKTVSVETIAEVRVNQQYQKAQMKEYEMKEQQKVRTEESIEHVESNRRMAIVEETGLPYSVADTIVALADKYDFYDHTIVGMINLESKYNIMATNVNTNGTVDKGLMQINSNTLPWLAKVSGNPDADPFNPSENVSMGVWYLNYLRKQCDGNLTCALARYNGDSTGAYQSVVRDRINQVASRMGNHRERMNQYGN